MTTITLNRIRLNYINIKTLEIYLSKDVYLQFSIDYKYFNYFFLKFSVKS